MDEEEEEATRKGCKALNGQEAELLSGETDCDKTLSFDQCSAVLVLCIECIV